MVDNNEDVMDYVEPISEAQVLRALARSKSSSPRRTARSARSDGVDTQSRTQ